MSTAAVDTNLLIWGVQETAKHEEQRYLIQRSRSLFALFQKERFRVIVPAIVMSEFLIGFKDDAERVRFETIVQQKFIIVPFDTRASLIAHRIWKDKVDPSVREQVFAGIKAPRAELKADTLVVASAIAAGATEFYGHEPRHVKLCEGFITFKNIDELELQSTIDAQV